MFFRKFPRFSGYSRPSSSTIRSALWENAHRSLAGLGVLSNRWRRFAANFCSVLFSAMASRGPTSENSDMENANKPASSWPLKQGPKKWSKHGCDKGTLTVATGLGTHKEKKVWVDIHVQAAGSQICLHNMCGQQRNSPMADPHFWVQIWTPKWGPELDHIFIPSFRSLLGPRFGIQIWTQKWGQPSENFAAARRGFASRFATH